MMKKELNPKPGKEEGKPETHKGLQQALRDEELENEERVIGWEVKNCYSSGEVEVDEDPPGLIGSNDGDILTRYFDTTPNIPEGTISNFKFNIEYFIIDSFYINGGLHVLNTESFSPMLGVGGKIEF